jgi:signal peptidase I
VEGLRNMQTYSKTKTKTSREIGLGSTNILELARPELAKKRPFRMQISGNSMTPNICDGDFVTVEAISSQKVRVGDIVLLTSISNTALVHRVVKMEDRNNIVYLTTCGDASNYQDVPVPVTNVLGRITLIESKDKLINLNNPFTRILSRIFTFFNRLKYRNKKD